MRTASPTTAVEAETTEAASRLGYQNGTDARVQRRQGSLGLPPRISCLDPLGYWRPPADFGPAVVFHWVAALTHLLTLTTLFFAGCVVLPNLVAHVVRGSKTFADVPVAKVVCWLFEWLPALGIFAPVAIARTWTLIRSFRRGPWIRHTAGGVEFPSLEITVAAADLAWSVQSEQFRDGDGQTIRRSIVRVAIAAHAGERVVDVTEFYGRSARDRAIRLAGQLERSVAKGRIADRVRAAGIDSEGRDPAVR